MTALPDIDARRRALTDTATTLLVEAGAGTGKTALMAGRVAVLLARGTQPSAIAAITFTEPAAAQLLRRITETVHRLAANQVDPELEPAFPNGVDANAVANLEAAKAYLDDLVITTIHGFCQTLIRPYPVEAGMDPGARIMDPAEAELTFEDVYDAWLRDRFADATAQDDLLVEALQAWQNDAISVLKNLAWFRRDHRTVGTESVTLEAADVAAFRNAVTAFRDWYLNQDMTEPLTDQIIREFEDIVELVDDRTAGGITATTLVHLAIPPKMPNAQQANTYAFKAYQAKGKWRQAAKEAGYPQTRGDERVAEAKERLEACQTAYQSFFGAISGALLDAFRGEVDEVLRRYEAHKRETAQLDFDDLLIRARELLASNDTVRQALADRFRHILVDEFQDTDPLQCEILWYLAGEAPDGQADAPWDQRALRDGQLFLVGDPKQSVYRFRGADVMAYLTARNAIERHAADAVLAISANFRSRPEVLEWVNARFVDVIQAQNLAFQPLTSALSRAGEPRVQALDVTVEFAREKPDAYDMREAEARGVADLCRRLVDSFQVPDEQAGTRPCRPGDIALLAPTGTNLWVFERYLEEQGLPIATQAGKGFFRRQEIQDLIALTRVLADGRDTLALGALLRGPLIGFTEEQLLDVVQRLPRSDPDRIPRLTVWTPPSDISDPFLAEVLGALQALAQRARATAPFQLLAEAVDYMNVRAVLARRHRGDAERALANVDRYLELARPYAVRGLRTFARDMRTSWEEGDRRTEGRPDAEEEAIQLITMHSAKGLEWPVVIPINTTTLRGSGGSGPFLRRSDDTMHERLGAIGTASYDDVQNQDKRETEQEHQRLWYVATTRASELLVLPRLDRTPSRDHWLRAVNLELGELPAIDPTEYPTDLAPRAAPTANAQTRDRFREEASRILALHETIQTEQPSRHERLDDGSEPGLTPAGVAAADEDASLEVAVQGGPIRGRVIHKLIEEVLTGETAETGLTDRADALLRQLGVTPAKDPADGPETGEIAANVERTLALSDVAAIRGRLLPELPVAAINRLDDNREQVVAGLVDAVAVDDCGDADVVIDWKSDVSPTPSVRGTYRGQLQSYLGVLGAREGWIVYTHDGSIDRVHAAA